ncbi:hypothetical protein PILCRDRAFT_610358 [Piloderma croceum F 1598]|uniref:Uncharacterized protein n=1 Tax=Piloderma croceum (strain F 1598) TaxID=765440 RepID=A0A0C3FDH4_PILCF|nr:hypothetical protein PILCRDRAFT_610358 [Piloderma croceum F 1598]
MCVAASIRLPVVKCTEAGRLVCTKSGSSHSYAKASLAVFPAFPPLSVMRKEVQWGLQCQVSWHDLYRRAQKMS